MRDWQCIVGEGCFWCVVEGDGDWFSEWLFVGKDKEENQDGGNVERTMA